MTNLPFSSDFVPTHISSIDEPTTAMSTNLLSTAALQKLTQQIKALNPAQKKAVESVEGPFLVIAGAGSGKTKVATLRIAHLISLGVHSKEIVGVTFTNKAAKEMKERVYHLLGSHILVSTFHSLGARILREFHDKIGYSSSFVIYDEDDKTKLMKACLRRLVKEAATGDTQAITVDDAVRSISALKNRSQPHVSSELYELFSLYQEELKKASAMDFDDLLYRTLQLLRENKDVRQILNKRWQYLLVDEYQDTNDVQFEIARYLAGPKENIFAVGDPDQSIYSWRGANVSHILSFKEHFPKAQIIRLEQNYRSTNIILNASNAVIENNQQRIDKKLWSTRGEGAPISCFVARSEKHEAEFVCDAIKKIIHSVHTYTLSNIAILYRTNAQSRSFEDELIRNHIPYVIWGGLSFYQRKEIKDIISYARLAIIPQDVVAFDRVINVPKRGIGATTVEKLISYSSSNNIPIINLIFDIVTANFEKDQFPGLFVTFNQKQKQGLVSFYESIKLLRSSLVANDTSSNDESAFRLISSAIRDTGYLSYLEKENEDTFIDRRENLEQLLAKAMEWDRENEETIDQQKSASSSQDEQKEEPNSGIIKKNITQFFELLSLETSQQESQDSSDRITMATVHNAKGLEFSAVFLVGLEEDLFPHINVKFNKEGSNSNLDIEEERRLMYVGMTRAKDILALSLSQMRILWGGQRLMKPSRFLYEVPQHYLKKVARFSISENKIEAHCKQDQVAALQHWDKKSTLLAASATPPSPPSSPIGSSAYTTAVPATTSSQKTAQIFQIGDIVVHTTHGVGRIESVAESSIGVVYDIYFTQDKTARKMVASLAPLTRIKSGFSL